MINFHTCKYNYYHHTTFSGLNPFQIFRSIRYAVTRVERDMEGKECPDIYQAIRGCA